MSGFWSDRRVLLTGGGGFLRERLERENAAAIFAPRASELDLRDAHAIRALLGANKPNLVIHAAGVVGGIGANRLHPGRFFYENAIMGIQLIEEARLAALREALPGETYIPKVPAARVVDLAEVLIKGRDIAITFTGIRPGEKIHEIMVSEEERYRTIARGDYYVITAMLPELRGATGEMALKSEYSSADITLDHAGLEELLAPHVESMSFGPAGA